MWFLSPSGHSFVDPIMVFCSIALFRKRYLFTFRFALAVALPGIGQYCPILGIAIWQTAQFEQR